MYILSPLHVSVEHVTVRYWSLFHGYRLMAAFANGSLRQTETLGLGYSYNSTLSPFVVVKRMIGLLK